MSNVNEVFRERLGLLGNVLRPIAHGQVPEMQKVNTDVYIHSMGPPQVADATGIQPDEWDWTKVRQEAKMDNLTLEKVDALDISLVDDETKARETAKIEED